MAITFDPVPYTTTTRQQCEVAAATWHRWGPTLEAWLGEATERMLDLAGVDAEREQAWAEITSELTAFEGPGGFVGPCELLVAAGTR